MSFEEYVLAELRCAHIRARLYVKEIETIGIALKAKMIDPGQAMEQLYETDTLAFLRLPDEAPVGEEIVDG